MAGIRPMLGAVANLSKLQFPVYLSPKLDGVRAIVKDGIVYSRTGKPIPNKYVQKMFSSYEGFDGELIVGDEIAPDTYRKTMSGVMTVDGTPNVYYHVFDLWNTDNVFKERYATLALLNISSKTNTNSYEYVVFVPNYICNTLDEILEKETELIKLGYEGVMLRNPNSLYKFNRSTIKQGELLKLKRFKDSEAKILSVEPLFISTDKPTINELGYSEHSHCKMDKQMSEKLGSITVKDLNTGTIFRIGSGFTDEERTILWKTNLEGKIVKYKYFEVGVKDKPRFPIFLGFRDPIDIATE